MADSDPERGRGMKFAEEQLLRHGWTQGKGLGREENGISEAIKVKVKCNKEGIGHKRAEEFTFHWWDHVFNKASDSLEVVSDQNGVKVRMEGEKTISNKRPRKAALSQHKVYGCFVKAATLLSGEEQHSSPDHSSRSSEEDEDQHLDLSTINKLTDADLMKACGGRTAHKGARHGLTMSAKLARLEQQEAEFMAKYGKKSNPSNNQPEKSNPLNNQPEKSNPLNNQPEKSKHAEQTLSRYQEETDKILQKKIKQHCEEVEEEEERSVVEKAVTKLKKKKKRKRDREKYQQEGGEPGEGTAEPGEGGGEQEGTAEPGEGGGEQEGTAHSSSEKQTRKKKRKSCREELEREESSPPRCKKKKDGLILEDRSAVEQEDIKDTVLPKKKKKKSKE